MEGKGNFHLRLIKQHARKVYGGVGVFVTSAENRSEQPSRLNRFIRGESSIIEEVPRRGGGGGAHLYWAL
jgi:hypothetical protein